MFEKKNRPKKVLIVVPSGGNPSPQSLASIFGQDYPAAQVSIVASPNKKLSMNPGENRLLNIIRNRNEARALALKTNAELFFWVDDDVVLPPNALSALMMQTGKHVSTIPVVLPNGKMLPAGQKIKEKHILAGYYQLKHAPFWVVGKWVGDNLFCLLDKPQPSITRVDMVGLGCVLMTREVLKKLDFRKEDKIFTEKNTGLKVRESVSSNFCNRAQGLGYEIFIDGNVICDHVKRTDEP